MICLACHYVNEEDAQFCEQCGQPSHLTCPACGSPANAGARFSVKDQVATGVLGVILAGFILVLTRPRLRADADGVTIRNHWGPFKTIPWDLVVGVEFPVRRHFARLVLPGEETIALYAVQRVDREQSVAVMRALRQLFAQTHAAVNGA